MKKDSQKLLEQADKLYEQGLELLQKDVILAVELLRPELIEICNYSDKKSISPELIAELRKLVPAIERLIGTPIIGEKKRARKVPTGEKVVFLVETLEGKKEGISKGELVRLYADKFGCKPSPTILDSAIANPAFSTQASGRNVIVSIKAKVSTAKG